jgi:alpha-ketoglutaric semialdehyde dehydrogenase
LPQRAHSQFRAEQIGAGFAGSLVMGVGQFCTNPGLVLALDSADLARFTASATDALRAAPAATMLTAGIATSYRNGVQALATHGAVETLAHNDHVEGKGAAALFRTTGAAFLTEHALHGEVFGPVSLLVVCRDMAELRAVAEVLEGQLTATLQIDEADYADAAVLLPVLERKVGRILVNGFPTGVEVSTAMVHGGPFPSTSDGRSTSVGTGAISRFLRPVCYQNMPQALLPQVLRDGQAGVWKRIDGVLGNA